MIPALVLLGSMTYSDVHILQEKFNDYQRSGRDVALAPHPAYPISGPLGESRTEIVEVDGKKVMIIWSESGQSCTFHEIKDERPDKVRREPFIVKVNKFTYLIYWQGKIKIKKILEGGEKTWDRLFNIGGPPEKPPETNGEEWLPDPTPTPRFEP